MAGNQTQLGRGDVIGGCKIERFIAEGGMGTVYRARKELLDLSVAVKVLHPALGMNPPYLKRFLREAKVAANLDHPSIVKVYDVGEENGRYYIVMEYIEGWDLRSMLDEHGPLSVRKALRVARQVAEGLGYAHEREVIHRDIKPANILVRDDGVAKIADLGLARPIREDAQVTTTGQILGTPAFMSPEQCRGDPIDARTDLYSLGATLYTILCGDPPFGGDTTPAVLHQVINDPPCPLQAQMPGIPDNVVALVQRMMAKHPGARYQTAREVVDAINEVIVARFRIAGEASRKPSEPLFPSVPWARLVELTLLGTLLGVVAYFFWPHMDAESSSPEGGAARHSQTAPENPATVADGEEAPQPEESERRAPEGWTSPDWRYRPRHERPRPGSGEREWSFVERPRARDPELDERIRGLRQSLLAGDADEVLEYFEPSARNSRRLHFHLAGILEALDARGLEAGTYLSRKTGPDEASTVLLFRRPEGGQPLGFPCDWFRSDGEWYVKLRSRRATDE